MNLIVLDDNPINPLKFISDFTENYLQDNGHITFLYYQHNKRSNMEAEIIEMYQNINVTITDIGPLDFIDIMNPLYNDSQNIFLYDYELEGDNVPDIYRIQIGYALNKISHNQDDKKRFFFYSSKANPEQLSNLKKFFPNHVLDVQKGFYNGIESVSIAFNNNEEFIAAING